MPRVQKPSQKLQPKNLSAEELTQAIKTIERRLSDLASLDISSITDRGDPAASALRLKINTSLAGIFGDDSPEHKTYAVSALDTLPLIMGKRHSVGEIRQGYQRGVQRASAKLSSLLDLLKERKDDNMECAERGENFLPSVRQKNNKVFVVHGHDEEAKQSVARFLEKIKLEPVILHEVASGGRTIIEKLEGESDVDFAVVLLTPDDVGSSAKNQDDLRGRARQNVILELGLFIGCLGRENVCALHKGNIELPSDYSGIIYVPMDSSDGWKLLLAREMRRAGIDIDMNQAL